MTSRNREACAVSRFLLALACLAGFADAGWKAGVSQTVITPTEALWMAGYGGRTAPAEGAHHDLRIRALALEDEKGHRGVLVATDTLGITKPIYEDVCRLVKDRCGLNRDQIVLNATHTHSGPVLKSGLYDTYPLTPEHIAAIEKYSTKLTGQLVDLIAAAIDNLEPAKVSRGVGTCTFAVNRRTNREPDVPMLREANLLLGPVDHSVPVLAVHRPDGSLKGVFFLYACHNTTLSWQLWCGDYAGFAQYALEKKYPGSVALFGMGCGADQNPLPRRTLELSEGYGNRLADAVSAVLESGLEPLPAKLETSQAFVPIAFDGHPSREELEKQKGTASNYVERWATRLLKELDAGQKWPETYPYPIQVWRLGGEQLLVTMGGEVVIDYDLRLKAELGDSVWVAGYVNDVMAYIPSRRVIIEGGYEGNSSMYVYGQPAHRWRQDTEERIVEGIHKLVDGLK
jgi:hypothetical protein